MPIRIVHRRFSNDVAIANASELAAAIADATPGQRLLLASGNYGEFPVPPAYTGEVIVQSADPANRAVVSGFNMGPTNLTLRDIDFVFDYVDEGDDANPFDLDYATNVWFDNCLFQGDLASGTGTSLDGYPVCRGLYVAYSTGVRVTNCLSHTWKRGIFFSRSDNCEVRGSEFYGVREDTINIANVRGLLIEENHFHDSADNGPNAGHRDVIQIFSSAASPYPTQDVTIRRNLIDVGTGKYSQSIFMRNEAVDVHGLGSDWNYLNFLIEENVIINNHTQGIFMGHVDGAIIRNNSLHYRPDGTAMPLDPASSGTPRIVLETESSSIQVTGNLTPAIVNIPPVPAGWTESGNVLTPVENYATIFTAESLADYSFVEITASGAGAPRSVYDLAA